MSGRKASLKTRAPFSGLAARRTWGRRNLATITLALLLVAGCDLSPRLDDAGVAEPAYASVASIITNGGCTAVTCHGGAATIGATLNFQQAIDSGTPITTLLNNVPSCEYAPMMRVDPGHPESSWLMIKLDPQNADASGHIQFTPDPSFDPTSRDPSCPPMGYPTFGLHMPTVGQLTSAQIETIRRWIAAGAPGPGGASND